MGVIKNLVGQRFGKLVVLEDDGMRKHRSVYWKCQCDCGKIHRAVSTDLKNGKVSSCGCAHWKNHPNQGGGVFTNLVGQRFGKLVVINRAASINNRAYWICQCDCGNTCIKSTHYLKNQAVTIRSCGCEEKKYIDLVGRQFGKLTVIKRVGTGASNTVIWECQCSCGNITNILSNELLRNRAGAGGQKSCGRCECSKGELKIMEILQKNNISFSSHEPCGCINPQTNKQLIFDFTVYDNNHQIKYFIEYDGSQHFSAKNSGWDTEEHLKAVQFRDAIKNAFCRNKNIPLIRIPYTHFDKINITDLCIESSPFILENK